MHELSDLYGMIVWFFGPPDLVRILCIKISVVVIFKQTFLILIDQLYAIKNIRVFFYFLWCIPTYQRCIHVLTLN